MRRDTTPAAAAWLVVRTAGPDDLLAVLAVHAGRDPGGRPPRSASRAEERTWARMLRSDELTVYVAELGGEPVGTATVMVMPNITYDCAPSAFIEAVVVSAEHRRQGVASTILRRALDDLRAAGCHKVQLLSHKRHVDDGAHLLYTSLGFVAEAEGFRLYLSGGPTAGRGPGS
ncbi:GNAT family N-acetyltransferase [Streptodolium elevatio]|uniref:GNAT family N-acetyltransferase n=1 Tax=Streptodolium elevatio TaxID=3157996 RepID=A0ABV3DMK0_9ACTN